MIEVLRRIVPSGVRALCGTNGTRLGHETDPLLATLPGHRAARLHRAIDLER
jgi:hypothetical protein